VPPQPGNVQSGSDQGMLQAVEDAVAQVQRSSMERAGAAAYLAGELQRILSADGVAIARLEQGEMVCLGSAGNAAEPGMVLETDSGLGAEAMQSAGSVYCPDTQTDPRVDAALCQEAGIRSVVMAAVRQPGAAPTGMVEVFSGRPQGFGAAHVDTLQKFAEMIGALLAHGATASAAIPRR